MKTIFINRGFMRFAALCLLALAASLLHSREARAQFTTTGTNTTTTNNVGIGTTAPSQQLQIHSTGTWAGTRVTTAATGTTINDGINFGFDDAYGAIIWNREASGVIFATGNAERFRIAANGNVGIGTAAPTFLLDVSGSTNTPFRVRDSAGREYFSTGTRTGPYPTWVAPVASIAGGRMIVDSTTPDGNNDTLIRRQVNSMIISPSDHPTLPGAFMVRQVGGYMGLFVDQNTNGNVGIGTTTPTAKLHVAGNITVDGNINAKYQDVAEWVPSTQKLAAGTVVILDPERTNQVLASTGSYDTAVAGVISAQPGISLGEAGEGKVLVATTGRVKVRVDATKAPVKIGDLLVTSDAAGVAMKSEPMMMNGRKFHSPGTIIGKALEPLASGTGEILVLLSLQ